MLDARRRQYLEAMGIDLWVRRAPGPDEAPQESPAEAAAPAAEARVTPEPQPAAPEPVTPAETEYPREPVPVTTPEMQAMPDSGPVAPAPAAPRREPEPVTPAAPADWPELEHAVAGCSRCPELVANRTRTVFGTGSRSADWMVIGEAPGADEDARGEPFVGRAGQLLTAMLKACGFAREQVFIANTLKCRPPNNRDPRPEEQAACYPYLQRQIELVAPRVILVVGRIAAQRLLETDQPIGKLRGRVHHLPGSDVPVVVTYHPAYLLRSPGEKAKAWEDLKLALRRFRQGE